MAIDFVVQDAAGAALGEPVTSTIDFLSLELPFSEFPMLAALMPWGKTVFNRKQAGWLSEELLRLKSKGQPQIEDDLRLLAEMCEEVASTWHLYLVALGD